MAVAREPATIAAMRSSLLVFCCLGAGCATDADHSWLGSHFDTRVWGSALVAQTQKTDQLVLELTPLLASAVLATQDHRLQEEATENQAITEGSTNNGDGTAVGLGVLATGLGIADWIHGDDGHSMEVLVESFLLTDGITELLKAGVGRQRPAKDSNSSFPSGHSSFAFTMATFLQRRIADSCDGWVANLGYLAYAPAAYVAIDRVEANRHWPSDVAFGAFLGIFVTNTVYDAHYGAPGQPGIFGVRGLRLESDVSPGGDMGLALVLRF